MENCINFCDITIYAFGMPRKILKQIPLIEKKLNNQLFISKHGNSLPKIKQLNIGNLESFTLQRSLILDAIENGKNTIELAGYIDGKISRPDYQKNDTFSKGEILNETKYNKYVMLYNRLKKVGLDTLSFRPPILLRLNENYYARLDGIHRIGFMIYLQFYMCDFLVFDISNLKGEVLSAELVKDIYTQFDEKYDEHVSSKK